MKLVEAALAEKAVLRRLMELYLYEFSELERSDVDDHGLFGYRWLDHYWTDPGRHAFLFRAEGKWAGFALVREYSYFEGISGPAHAIAEFFVMHKYRRRGVGTTMARLVFERFPGRWEIAEMPGNVTAQAFWRRVIGDFTKGSFEEHVLANDSWNGPVQVFRTP